MNNVQRRNRIIKLISDWGLVEVSNEEAIADIAPLNQIKVLAYKDKSEWILEQKYNIGKKGKPKKKIKRVLNSSQVFRADSTNVGNRRVRPSNLTRRSFFTII